MADWQARFRTRVVSWSVPAALNRERALAASNRSGVTQLYGWDVTNNTLSQLTDRPTGTTAGTISADGRWVHYVDDQAGDELGHWLRVPVGGGQAVDLTPELPRYAAYDLATSADGRLLAFTAIVNDEHAVRVLPDPAAGGGTGRVVYRSPHNAAVVGFDRAGRLLGVLTSERTGLARFSLLVFDVASGERVAELWDGPESSLSGVAFSPLSGDSRIVAASDVGGASRPLIWDPLSGARQDLALGDWARGECEVVAWDWSLDGSSILLARVANAVQQLAVFEPASGRLRLLDHPAGVYGYFGEVGNWFDANNDIIVAWQDAAHPTTVARLDGASGRLREELLKPEPPPPPSRPFRSVSFEVDAGQPIQAWLAVPAGEPPFPAVIETHGGPESATLDSFAPRAQAWLDHGYAFLTINYRGSTTFGRAFKEAIWGQPGELEVRDIVAGRAWLVERGVARPDEIVLTGWSYGGYLTLQALGRAPGLWAAGLAGIAVADWVSEYEDENDSLRAYDRALFGGSPAEKMDAYVRASPLTYCAAVDAPVLIIQGRNDTRCPARQVELYQARMRELGKPIEVVWFDAGHAAGADIERMIGHVGTMLDFAERALAGRRAARV
jgi:Tol biopolymer transport system component/dienelactone hydrolase